MRCDTFVWVRDFLRLPGPEQTIDLGFMYCRYRAPLQVRALNEFKLDTKQGWTPLFIGSGHLLDVWTPLFSPDPYPATPPFSPQPPTLAPYLLNGKYTVPEWDCTCSC